MTKSTSAYQGEKSVRWGSILLDQTLVKALVDFRNTPRNAARSTEWYAKCMAGQPALVFFKGPLKGSEAFRITASQLAADAYEELRDQTDAVVIKPSAVKKMRESAQAVRATLPPGRYLPVAAKTQAFKSGLDALCQLVMPVTATSSNSGDACARVFTLSLASRFAKAFREIPVEYIHSLVTFGWPSRSASATWRVLDATTTERIKREADDEVAHEALAQSTAVLAIHSASTTRHIISDAERETVDQLQYEIGRLQQGKRRFPSDAARLRALRSIAESLDDPALATDLVTMIDGHLQEFLA